MNVNLHLSGELETFVNQLVERGLAANKTEAIRLAVVRYYEKSMVDDEADAEEAFRKATIRNGWDNPGDEKASQFYIKRYLSGKKKGHRPGQS